MLHLLPKTIPVMSVLLGLRVSTCIPFSLWRGSCILGRYCFKDCPSENDAPVCLIEKLIDARCFANRKYFIIIWPLKSV